MQIINITENNFDRVDFSEATIIDIHYCPKKLDILSFTVWGVTLLLGEYWKHDKSFLRGYSEDMYVAGIGTVWIEGFCGGDIEVYAYDNVLDEYQRTIFAKNHDGSDLVYKKRWDGMGKEENSKEYLWECVISWPYGYSNMKICSNASISYGFSIKDLVSTSDYLKDPKIYKYRLNP